MISVVCVYNDWSIYTEYLLSSVQRQKGGHELIAMDNRDGHFKSAAQALNDGGRKANGAFIMFAHQDVRFYPETWLSDAEKMLDSLQNVGIAGVAGKKDWSGVKTVITHGDPPHQAGSLQPTEPLRVQTVDECLFFVPRDIFATLNFDEHICDNWHLYAAEYSLSVREMGLVAYVLPLHVYHKSMGQFSEAYYTVLKKVIGKHKKYYSIIFATTGNWITVVPVRIQRAGYSFWRIIRVFIASGRVR